jgi:hypothetical protein
MAPRRLQQALGALGRDQRLAGLAALGLVAAMLLPWYEKSVYDPRARAFVSESMSAFGAVSFVEAAVFLVAVGVLALLFARGERRAFELPGGDGTVILAAGAWAALLIFYRALDRPDVEGQAVTVDVKWGFLVAFAAAGALALAGWRLRQGERAGPPAREDGRPTVEL